MKKEDAEKIDTDQARAEFEARKRMADEDDEKILGRIKKRQEIELGYETNFLLYNFIMKISSFKECNSMQEACHTMFRNLWPHMRRLESDRATLLKRLDRVDGHDQETRDIKDSLSPMEIAAEAMRRIQDAARRRSKANTYGIEAKKKGIISTKEAKELLNGK